jgi:phospholipid/cholesterol/gamma-HCH transport system substrate-binding protein
VKRAIRDHLRDFLAIMALLVISVAVAGYVLGNQRMRFPLIEERPMELKAAFSTAQAVEPGQGQTVRVSGVRIGDVTGVELSDGQALVIMAIDREYEGFIREDATALLRPKTGLKDMFIELEPGSDGAPAAPEGFTLPLTATQPDINPDELLAMLDEDTRDYLQLLVNGAGKGLEGRGGDLREVFRRFEPTHRDIARVTGAVARRRGHLRSLITGLDRLNEELASKDGELARLVSESSQVFRAFASEDRNLSEAVERLPGALRQTTETLTRVERFADVLGPTSERLRPAARALDPANRAVRPFVREAAPILERRIRPFVREARPLARELRGPSRRLADATPDLHGSFVVLNHLFNTLGFNPNGREGPENQARQEGYLFWLAWLNHQAVNLFATADAHGSFRPIFLAAPCSTFEGTLRDEPQLEFLLGLTPLLTSSEACGRDDGSPPEPRIPALPGGASPLNPSASAKGGKP